MVPLVSPVSRAAPIVPEGLIVEQQEMDTANRLADAGLRVEFRPISHVQGVKNIDAVINGELWEFKSPRGGARNTISNQLSRAKGQGARNVAIDTARSPLDDAEVLAELARRLERSRWFSRFIHVAHDGTVWLMIRK